MSLYRCSDFDDSLSWSVEASSASDAAQQFAQRLWDHHDGWEYLSDGMTRVVVQCEGEPASVFRVRVEFDPTFYVEEEQVTQSQEAK